jgi:hypothetical protein
MKSLPPITVVSSSLVVAPVLKPAPPVAVGESASFAEVLRAAITARHAQQAQRNAQSATRAPAAYTPTPPLGLARHYADTQLRAAPDLHSQLEVLLREKSLLLAVV